MVAVGVLSKSWNEVHEAVLRGLRRYRDRFELSWRIVSCTAGNESDWPRGAFWVVLRPPMRARVLNHHDPQLPLLTMVGSETTDSRRCCQFDQDGFGATALQYFLEQGYRQFASIELSDHDELAERRAGFGKACRLAGEGCLEIKRRRDLTPEGSDQCVVECIKESLTRQRSPLAVYVASDGEASWLRSLCRAHGLRIPHDVAILGTGNHQSTCSQDDPELSSLAFPWSVMARVAASHVHRLVQQADPEPPSLLKLFHVVERASTAQVSIQDSDIAKALRWLEDHLDHPQPLAGLQTELGLSRPTICRKFKVLVGMSPKQKHELYRLVKATHLLEQSELSLQEIASLCGYSGHLAFGVAFKRRRGIPPGQWRAAFQDS